VFVEILLGLFALMLAAAFFVGLLSLPFAVLYVAILGVRHVWRRLWAPQAAPVLHMRVGDAERSVTLYRLGESFALGRLTLDELEDRCAAVWDARTFAELALLESDLPPLAPRRSRIRRGPRAARAS